MPYEVRPGQFSLFKNTKKTTDKHPDYRGDGLDIDGRPVWVSAWLKTGKAGKFMSCSMQLKEQGRVQDRAQRSRDDESDSPPF